MGIRNINQLLKQIPECHKVIPWKDLHGKRIAIDGPVYAYNYSRMSGAHFLNIIQMLLDAKAVPIVVLDGEFPKEKLKEQQDRKKRRRTEYEDLETFISQTSMCTEPTKWMLKIYRTKLGIPAVLLPPWNRSAALSLAQKELDRLREPKIDVDKLKQNMNAMEVAVITADGEAEFMCIKMCKNGTADFCMTRDTDALAAGTGVILRTIRYNGIEAVDTSQIFAKLSITKDQWIDICILCGTDYNKNVPGVGPIKALELIQKYKNIENVPADKKPPNYKRVREIFTQ